tara:strand:+ start:349 stop:531 length:183 start_codon:yes stop_codon:yes gene_type:complete
MLSDGMGIATPQEEDAFTWLLKAAQDGDTDAMVLSIKLYSYLIVPPLPDQFQFLRAERCN